MTIVRIGAPRKMTPGYSRGVKQVYEDAQISLFDLVQMLTPVYRRFQTSAVAPQMSFHHTNDGRHNFGVQVELSDRHWNIGNMLDELSNHRRDGRMQLWQDTTMAVAFPMPDQHYKAIVEELVRSEFMGHRDTRLFHLDGLASITTHDCDDYVDFVAILRPTGDSIVNLKSTLVLVGVDVAQRIKDRTFDDLRLNRGRYESPDDKYKGYVIDEGLMPDPHIVAIDARSVLWAENHKPEPEE